MAKANGSLPKFCKRHYEAIATTIQNPVMSDDEHDEEGLAELEQRRQSIAGEFADLFASLIAIKNDWRIYDITWPRDGKPETLRGLFRLTRQG